jgi:DNA-binding transcriptional ArsR family regulator
MDGPVIAFEVLAEPTRLKILEQLRPGERTVGSLVAALGVCQPGVSRHLRILRDAGFVGVRSEGQRRLYSLRRQPFQKLDAWIRDYRDLVDARLDRLQALVEGRPVDSLFSRLAHRGDNA